MARRCKACSLDWPKEWDRCGRCKGVVDVLPQIAPMPADEAMRITAHADFELFLAAETPEARRERKRKADEERARLDAIFNEVVREQFTT